MNESNPDMTYKPCKSCKSYEEKSKSYEKKCKSYEEKCKSYEEKSKSYEKKCKSYEEKCKSYEEKCKSYEKKCKSYEEKIRSKESLHSEMVLDYEIEKSKLQNSVKFSNLENESLQKSMNILQKENNSFESKIDSKNKVIEELKLKLKSLTEQNLVQNAEILSLKLHNSRQGDFLLTQNNTSLEISSFAHCPDENNNNTSDTNPKHLLEHRIKVKQTKSWIMIGQK